MLHATRITFIAVFAIISFVGCKPSTNSSSSAAAGKTTIEFWHYLSREQGKPLDDLIRKFETANPDINVNAVFQGNPGQLKQKLDGSFASGTNNNPVVSLVYESWADDFHTRGYLDPVQNYIDGPDGFAPEEVDDFVKAFVHGNTWDGKLVTLPFNKSIYLLYLNMDMLSDAGFTTAPATQAEFADAVRKMTKRQGNRITTYGWGLMPKGESFTTLLLARGGELVAADGTPKLNSPTALEVMQYLKNLQYPEKNLYVTMDYMNVPFANRQIGMFIYSTASLPYNKSNVGDKFDYRAAAVPGAAGVESRYLMQGTNIAIYANRPEKERQAAWKLLKFLTTPENGAYFVTRSGYMPYRYSMLEQPEMKKHMAEDEKYALGANLVLTDKGQQEPKVRNWEGIRTEIDTAVDQLLSRPDSNPKALLDALQAKAEEKLKK